MEAAEKPRVYIAAFVATDAFRDDESKLLTALRIAPAFKANPLIFTPKPGGIPDPAQAQKFYEPARCKLVMILHCESDHTFDLQIKVKNPSGVDMYDEQSTPSGPCTLAAGALGQLILKIDLALAADLAGTHWMEIYVDGEVATKLPLLIYHSDETPFHPEIQHESAWSVTQGQ
jgi:hypothetical protein